MCSKSDNIKMLNYTDLLVKRNAELEEKVISLEKRLDKLERLIHERL